MIVLLERVEWDIWSAPCSLSWVLLPPIALDSPPTQTSILHPSVGQSLSVDSPVLELHSVHGHPKEQQIVDYLLRGSMYSPVDVSAVVPQYLGGLQVRISDLWLGQVLMVGVNDDGFVVSSPWFAPLWASVRALTALCCGARPFIRVGPSLSQAGPGLDRLLKASQIKQCDPDKMMTFHSGNSRLKRVRGTRQSTPTFWGLEVVWRGSLVTTAHPTAAGTKEAIVHRGTLSANQAYKYLPVENSAPVCKERLFVMSHLRGPT